MASLRLLQGFASVIAAVVTFIILFDCIESRLNPRDGIGPLLLQANAFYDPSSAEFFASQWTGRINFAATSGFLWVVAAIVVLFSTWVIWERVAEAGHNLLILSRVFILELCIGLSIVFGMWAGFNGLPPPLDEPCAAVSLRTSPFKDAGDEVRDRIVTSVFCHFRNEPDGLGYVKVWSLFNWNSIICYITSSLTLIAVASVALESSGAKQLNLRVAQLRWLLISLSAIISIGTIQYRLYLDWPISLVKGKDNLRLIELANACTNDISIPGSLVVLLGFLGPTLWLQYDLGKAGADAWRSLQFRTLELVGAVVLIAAPLSDLRLRSG